MLSIVLVQEAGAGEGNRTLVISLEGCCSTIELHPQTLREFGGLPSQRQSKSGIEATETARKHTTRIETKDREAKGMVEEAGFEPA